MLEAIHLAKRYGTAAAVDDISFAATAGEVLGLVGASGAGKSTIIRIMAGALAPSAGTAVVCGHDILARPLAAKRRIGYLPECAPAYRDMTVAAFLGFIAQVRGFRGAEKRKRVERVAELLGMREELGQPVERLPKGGRRRLGVAQALLHDPPVVILDEPTAGLDPNQKARMYGVIRGIRADKAIVLSTRRIDDVEAVCDRAIILGRGRILASGSPEELAGRSPYHNAVRLGLLHGAAGPAIAAELALLPGVRSIAPASDDEGEGWWLFPWRSRPIIREVADLARARDWPVICLRTGRGRLEDVFNGITTPDGSAARETLRDAA